MPRFLLSSKTPPAGQVVSFERRPWVCEDIWVLLVPVPGDTTRLVPGVVHMRDDNAYFCDLADNVTQLEGRVDSHQGVVRATSGETVLAMRLRPQLFAGSAVALRTKLAEKKRQATVRDLHLQEAVLPSNQIALSTFVVHKSANTLPRTVNKTMSDLPSFEDPVVEALWRTINGMNMMEENCVNEPFAVVTKLLRKSRLVDYERGHLDEVTLETNMRIMHWLRACMFASATGENDVEAFLSPPEARACAAGDIAFFHPAKDGGGETAAKEVIMVGLVQSDINIHPEKKWLLVPTLDGCVNAEVSKALKPSVVDKSVQRNLLDVFSVHSDWMMKGDTLVKATCPPHEAEAPSRDKGSDAPVSSWKHATVLLTTCNCTDRSYEGFVLSEDGMYTASVVVTASQIGTALQRTYPARVAPYYSYFLRLHLLQDALVTHTAQEMGLAWPNCPVNSWVPHPPFLRLPLPPLAVDGSVNPCQLQCCFATPVETVSSADVGARLHAIACLANHTIFNEVHKGVAARVMVHTPPSALSVRRGVLATEVDPTLGMLSPQRRAAKRQRSTRNNRQFCRSGESAGEGIVVLREDGRSAFDHVIRTIREPGKHEHVNLARMGKDRARLRMASMRLHLEDIVSAVEELAPVAVDALPWATPEVRKALRGLLLAVDVASVVQDWAVETRPCNFTRNIGQHTRVCLPSFGQVTNGVFAPGARADTPSSEFKQVQRSMPNTFTWLAHMGVSPGGVVGAVDLTARTAVTQDLEALFRTSQRPAVWEATVDTPELYMLRLFTALALARHGPLAPSPLGLTGNALLFAGVLEERRRLARESNACGKVMGIYASSQGMRLQALLLRTLVQFPPKCHYDMVRIYKRFCTSAAPEMQWCKTAYHAFDRRHLDKARSNKDAVARSERGESSTAISTLFASIRHLFMTQRSWSSLPSQRSLGEQGSFIDR